MIENLDKNAVSSSNFKDQSRERTIKKPSEAAQTNLKYDEGKSSEKKLSTMIPLGAPKGESDLRDAYK